MEPTEVHEVLRRAQEIESQQGVSLDGNTDVEGLIKAADEVGIKRDSVLQALRERISVVDEPLRKDDFVFARLPDGCYHPGTVASLNGDVVEVTFTNGGSASVQVSAIHRFRGLPDEPIYCELPRRGWVRCSVQTYDPKDQMVMALGPDGKTHWFGLPRLRYYDEAPVPVSGKPGRLTWRLVAVLCAVSGILGVIVTWLALRG